MRKLLFGVILLSGCGAELPTEEFLPTQATRIVDHGNGWMSYDLMVAGQNHSFMYQVIRARGNYNSVSAVTTTHLCH